MTTQRRTARITTTSTATPTTTAFATPATFTKRARPTKKRPKPPYEPAALYPAYSRATKELLGYGCPSRDGKKTYHVTRDEYGWHCTCDARVPCCHIEAVEEMEEIKAEAKKAEERLRLEAERDARLAQHRADEARRSTAPLNGNKSFSLFK